MRNEKKGAILLNFYSEGCIPCKKMDSVVTEFAEENDAVEVRRIEASSAPETFDKYGIGKVPTFVCLKDGKERGRIVGECGRRDIERLVSEG